MQKEVSKDGSSPIPVLTVENVSYWYGTKRALDEIRKEVANLTVVATEKVTRKSLTPEDHRRLIEDALREVDFSTLAGEEGSRN